MDLVEDDAWVSRRVDFRVLCYLRNVSPQSCWKLIFTISEERFLSGERSTISPLFRDYPFLYFALSFWLKKGSVTSQMVFNHCIFVLINRKNTFQVRDCFIYTKIDEKLVTEVDLANWIAGFRFHSVSFVWRIYICNYISRRQIVRISSEFGMEI